MMRYFYLLLMISFSLNIHAQFNTIQKRDKLNYIIIEKETILREEVLVASDTISSEVIEVPESGINDAYRLARKKEVRGKDKRQLTTRYITSSRLEGLSIKKLYKEILDNDIKHPKIVLAQAILETGWFRSSVCRNKGNLFGLTNPRTGQYYEFDHWKESVKAYKNKVQYKYKGGNYLLWLQKIGYAEDPRYVSSLIRLLEQHFL